jgi:hypothetical protein
MLTKRIIKLLVVAVTVLALTLPSARAQVVSAGMTGTVVNETHQPVAGAMVTATHVPTNTTFKAVTNAAGRFSLRGMPVGGPYKITATANELEIEPLTDVETTLGEVTDIELVGKSEVVKLEKYVATASRSDLDANATGASSVLSTRRISAQPTVNRSFADLLKTNPFVSIRASQQVQALGTNSRYNNIMLDGAKINDSFGLASTGLFSITNPFSIDAIEQVNISLTPYDVTQSGSTGVYMNVVSKSGTNEFHGTVYDIFTDQNWQGKDLTGTSKGTRPAFKERYYGFTLGGPIIPDRLFFFVNFEKDIQDAAPVTPGFTPSSSFLDALKARATQLPGTPDLGTFGGSSTSRTYDQKRLAKLDWNITADHRLSVRYSDTNDARPNSGALRATAYSGATITGTPTLSSTSTALSSNFYTLPSKEKVWASQLFSNWSDSLKTQLRYSYTKQDGIRLTPINFPEIRIFSVPDAAGANPTGSGTGITMGTEVSSMGNGVQTTTKTWGGSADYNWRTFTFTAGSDHEASDFLNYFRQGSYGVFAYKNLADFQADKPFGFYRAVVRNGTSTADISSYRQTGAFAQIRWEPTARFNATLGLRVDWIGAPTAVPYNASFESAFHMTNAGTIDGTTNPAPRFSFNYALDDKRMTQIRGGYGIFLGRNPWVWISNSYGNFGVARYNIQNFMPTGTTFATIDTSKYTGPTLNQYLSGTYTNTDIGYKFDAKDPIGRTDIPPSATTAQVINLMKPGLKLPTVTRGNIAVDRKLPFLDAVASIEYINTRQIVALFLDNMNLKPTTTGIDGRQRFAGSAGSAPIVPGFGDVLRVRNVHAGGSEAVGISLDRPMKNSWAYTLAYTHTHATEAQTLNSSTAGSNYRFNPIFNQNRVEVYRSDYEVRNRIQASVSKEFRYGKDFVTTLSLYYEGRTGMPYSYVYNNDLNTDGYSANDLIAIPTDENDSRFDFSSLSGVQKTAYFNYLKSSGLSRYAGGYAPRNAFVTPWQNRLDLRIVQDLPITSLPIVHKVKMQLFADFLNFGAWASSSVFNYVELLNTTTTNGGQTRAFGAATYDATTGKIKPTFNDGSATVLSLDANNQVVFGANVPRDSSTSTSVIRPNNAEARWKIQAGVKVSF